MKISLAKVFFLLSAMHSIAPVYGMHQQHKQKNRPPDDQDVWVLIDFKKKSNYHKK